MATEKLASIRNLPDISFIGNKTLEDVQAEMVADYQKKYKEATGRELRLRRADPESLKLYAASVQIYHMYLHIDMSGKMDLLKYAYGSFLDHLGALRGVKRLAASPAAVMVRFTLSAPRPSVIVIPQGTRVTDGEIYFGTDMQAEIAAGDTYADITCTCLTDGESGNRIPSGAINTIVDPVPYIEKAASIEESSGGSDEERDEDFAYRIYLSPGSYSVAGPSGAYKYYAKSFSSSIGDVDVSSPLPGDVEIRFLLADGSLPSESMCVEMLKFISADDVRPFTDHVSVLVPDIQEFDIAFTYYINKSDIYRAGAVQKAVEDAVNEYIKWQTGVIGRDINPDMLIRKVMEAGAKRAEITSPSFQKVPCGHVARPGTRSVICGGMEDD